MKLGGIECGGTKFICAVGDEFGNIEQELVITTTTPEETLNKVIEFYKINEVQKIGIGSFGPVEINKNSNNYGSILDTPKVEWSNFNIIKYLQKEINVPMTINTDVNVAALAEIKVGNSKDLNSILYITIGTGIGVGAIIDNKIINGVNHTEMGHIALRKHPNDNFEGNCLFHKDCFEGLASGPAIEKRYNLKGEQLENNEEVWDVIGYYIGQALAIYTFIFSPQRIVIGGGVAHQKLLLPIIKKYFVLFNNGYIKNDYIKDLDSYIQLTSLNNRAGLIGSILISNQ
jgi:fructokinase